MIAYFLLLAVRQSDLSSDLNSAVQRVKIGSPDFKKSISKVLEKYDIAGGKFQSQRTLGNPNGMIVSASEYKENTRFSPTWYRIFVWSDGALNHAQILKKVRFSDGQSFTQGEAFFRDDRLTIVGSEVNGGNGERAALAAYRYIGGKWKLVQHLLDRQEGGAFFVRNHRNVDPTKIRVLTRTFTKYLQQPHVGPLPNFESAWKLVRGKYVQGSTRLVPTPVSELDILAGYVTHHNRDAFERRVPATYQARLWNALRQYAYVQSISNDVEDETTTLRFGDDGPVVKFGKQGDRWVPVRWTESE